MDQRPVIFISAVSKELRTARGFAARLLHSLGYEPKDMDFVRAEHGLLRSVHGKWIRRSQGVIQLVGKCYGAEPDAPDPDFGRCSYTQFEAHYARKIGKPVWYFFIGDGFNPDPHDPEPDELRDLQRAYCDRIVGTTDIRKTFNSDAELENCIRRIQDKLEELRSAWRDEQRRARRFRVFAGIGIALLLALGIAGLRLGGRMKRDTVVIRAAAVETKDTARRTEIKVDALPQAVAEAIQRNASGAPAVGGRDDATRRTILFAEVEKKYGLKAGTLEKELPDIARRRAEDAAIPKLDRAEAAYAAFDYPEAERLAMEAYAEAKKAVPLDRHKLIKALELAGGSASARRDDEAALAHLTAASKLTDKTADPLEWARVYNALASELDDHDEAAQAAALLREVIAVRKDRLGAEHRDTLASRNNLAIALHALGKNAEAVAEHRAVLAIMEHVLGAEHPDTLVIWGNLANALDAPGKHTEAEAENRAVLAVMERVLGAEHPDTLKSRFNLAVVLQEQGKNAEAEAEHRAVLTIRERVLGAEHADTLASRNKLANALQALGKNAEAGTEYRAVLAIQERALGAEHPATLKSRANLADALYVQGKTAEAEAENRAVLTIRERVLGAEHPDTLMSRNKLAIALREHGRNAEAEAEHLRILWIRERVLGAEHPDVAQSSFNLARCLMERDRNPEALGFARRALEIWQKVLGNEHAYTKEARLLVSILTRATGK